MIYFCAQGARNSFSLLYFALFFSWFWFVWTNCNLAFPLLSGHKWRSHRKLIAPTFHLNVLKGFIDLFNENSRQVVKKLDLELGKTFDAHDHMSEATVEILLGKNNFNAFYVFLIHLFIHQNWWVLFSVLSLPCTDDSNACLFLPLFEYTSSPAVMHNCI